MSSPCRRARTNSPNRHRSNCGSRAARSGTSMPRSRWPATGERRWIYDAKMPLFAPPAVAAGVVYVGDLKGVIHAIDLSNGTAKWTLDLGTHPEVKAPGMIYGGPVLHNGRLFVATCNLEGPYARQPTVVVCVGEK